MFLLFPPLGFDVLGGGNEAGLAVPLRAMSWFAEKTRGDGLEAGDVKVQGCPSGFRFRDTGLACFL